MTHRKTLIKLIEKNAYRHDSWRVFSDFVEMAAISLSNAVDLVQRDKREARYLQIVGQYEREEGERFAQMLAELVMEMEANPTDVLGEVFMEMDMGSKWHGQFFTPFHLCRAMACTLDMNTVRSKIEQNGFIRVSEPACGGAAMIIALAIEMQTAGINFQRHMHVVAQDLDEKAVHMAYVQLSLLHIPAVVIYGNTLSLEERARWYTPAHILGGWGWRLAREDRADPVEQVMKGMASGQPNGFKASQLNLFEEEIAA